MSSRQITSAEELEKLSRGATLVDRLGDVWTNDGDPEDQWGSVTANEAFGGPQWCGSTNIQLPATLVYDPEAQ